MDATMNEVFGNAGATAPVEGVSAPQTSEKKEKINAMKDALKATINNDPEFQTKLRRLSGSVKVVNTLGYGQGGNIIVDKALSTKEKRVLKQTPQICGYKLENIGEETIEYQTMEYAPNAEGKWVGNTVKKSFAPGQQIDLDRKHMTIFCARPEISFTLANGKIVVSGKRSAKTLDEELMAYYFHFDKNEDGTTTAVNDDEVKLSIDDNGKVKPEYEATFGYFNNPKEGRAPKSKGNKFTTQDLAANFINSMLQESNM